MVDLSAVRAATRSELAVAAAAATRNAGDLVLDAEILAEAHRAARAYSLAALAVEEVGKGFNLGVLAGMPDALKERAPVGRMLEWHQLRQAKGQLLAAVPYGPPGLASRLLAISVADLARVLRTLKVPMQFRTRRTSAEFRAGG
jgi:hypothetical protein